MNQIEKSCALKGAIRYVEHDFNIFMESSISFEFLIRRLPRAEHERKFKISFEFNFGAEHEVPLQ